MVLKMSSNGLRDWLLQRVTAVYLLAYTGFMLYQYKQMGQGGKAYLAWFSMFHVPAVRWGTLLAVLAVLIHAWLGLWVVLTDYVKSTCFRLFLQVLVGVWSWGLGLWALDILGFNPGCFDSGWVH